MPATNALSLNPSFKDVDSPIFRSVHDLLVLFRKETRFKRAFLSFFSIELHVDEDYSVITLFRIRRRRILLRQFFVSIYRGWKSEKVGEAMPDAVALSDMNKTKARQGGNKASLI